MEQSKAIQGADHPAYHGRGMAAMAPEGSVPPAESPWRRDLVLAVEQVLSGRCDVTAVTYKVEPDIAAVTRALWAWPSWCGSGSPARAWENAVSGDTAARLDTGAELTEWGCTERIIRKAAAYGWWPQETSDGDYIAVPIDRWVADGHPYTRIVPSLAVLLDRWNVSPVVIDGLDDRIVAIEDGSTL